MSHSIHGIICSFKYEGILPNVVLVGNYHFIPFKNRHSSNYVEQKLAPYEELTIQIRKLLKEFSFKGKCAYIETNYFGGSGTQISEVWDSGKKIGGPYFSSDGIDQISIPIGVSFVSDSINQSLKIIGIYKHNDKDEFDSARLGSYRSNEDFFAEYELSKNKG